MVLIEKINNFLMPVSYTHLIPLTCLHTQIRILCEQYSYLRNDVPGKKPGYSQAQGIGRGAWDAQARQTWIWENGVF